MKETEMMIALQRGTFTFDVYQQIDNIRKRVTEALTKRKTPGTSFCKKDTAYRMSDRWRDPEGGKCDQK